MTLFLKAVLSCVVSIGARLSHGLRASHGACAMALAFFLAAGAAAQQPTIVFAAASLNGALDSALKDFPADVRTSYGGSGAIARQVAIGAPADLVILAHPVWDNWLEERLEKSVHVAALLRNRLVLVGQSGAVPFEAEPTPEQLLDRLGDGRLAMGQRDTVPAGQYGRDWLEDIEAWDRLQNKLAEADNVRTTLAYVARGEAPLGVVYASDAMLETGVEVLWRIPEGSHPPIRYPARALSPRGVALLDHLQTIEAQARFAVWGFRPGESAK